MKDIYYAVISGTIGDTICATPSLRKLYQVYQRKINVVSQPDSKSVWINNPYIDKIYTFPEFVNDFKGDKSVINYHESYVLPGLHNQFGMQRKFNMVDLRQVHANDLGIELLPEEMRPDKCGVLASVENNENEQYLRLTLINGKINNNTLE